MRQGWARHARSPARQRIPPLSGSQPGRRRCDRPYATFRRPSVCRHWRGRGSLDPAHGVATRHESAEPPVSNLSAIGLMSGTSYDGVDVALINTDGETIGRLGPTGYRAYSDAERAVLRRAIAAAGNLADRNQRPEALIEAEALLTAVHAEAVQSYLTANGMSAADVTVVGFHGQTVLHQPDRHLTVQLGNGAELASRLGIPVVYDFRAADVAAGGEGAPI